MGYAPDDYARDYQDQEPDWERETDEFVSDIPILDEDEGHSTDDSYGSTNYA